MSKFKPKIYIKKLLEKGREATVKALFIINYLITNLTTVTASKVPRNIIHPFNLIMKKIQIK